MYGKTEASKDAMQANKNTPPTYNSYLKVSDLKELQVCLSEPAHHDEPLFIIIHQTYELWFKLILHEIDMVKELLTQDTVKRATFYMRRINAIMRHLVQQIHILETMTPRDFLGFRNSLSPASGFQSSQFREIEFAGGLKSDYIFQHFSTDPMSAEALKKRYEDPSIPETFYAMLRRQGLKLEMPPQGASEEEQHKFEAMRVREFCKIYYEEGDIHDLCEAFVEFDELIFLWRTHHVTVVERIIGFRRGTGGSEGVGYLRSTLDKRCFPDLWQVRTALEP